MGRIWLGAFRGGFGGLGGPETLVFGLGWEGRWVGYGGIGGGSGGSGSGGVCVWGRGESERGPWLLCWRNLE